MADIKDVKATGESLGNVANQLEDIGGKLERVIERLSAGGEKFNSTIEKATRQSLDLGNIFDDLADTMKNELPKGIITGADLQKKMLSDAKLFNKVQEKTNDLTQEILKEGWAKIEERMKKTNKSADQIVEAQERWNMLSEFAVKQKDKEFALLKRQDKQLKSINVLNISGKKLVEDLEQSWRKPSASIDGYLTTLSNLPTKLKEISEKHKEFNKLESAQKRAAIAATGLSLAWTGVIGILTAVFRAFKSTYDFVDTKVFPSNAKLNKEFGNVGSSLNSIKSQAVSTGVQFEQLGLSFDQGAAAVRELGSAMMTDMIPKDTLREALKLSEYVGLGAEQTGKLLRQFQAVGISGKEVGSMFKNAAKAALDYGVPVNQVRRDLGENLDILQRFGLKNIQVMSTSAAKARSYGLTIKEVTAAFGKQMDTFEGTSDTAAKLNSIFGTHINSYKLMLETDPVKRMEMLRGELVKQGKTWEKLNVFEKNVITSTLGVNEEQAALVLGNEKTISSMKKQMAEREHQAKIDAEWNRGLGNIKETIVALGPKVDLLLRAFADFVSQLFGFGPAAGKMVKTGEQFGQSIDNITKAITEFTNGQGMKDLKSFLFDVKTILEAIGSAGKTAFDWLKNSWVSKAIDSQLTKLADGLSDKREQATIDKANAMSSFERAAAMNKASVSPLAGSVRDGVITKQGKVIKFSPDDNIMATKSPIISNNKGATASAGQSTNQNAGSLQDIRIVVQDIYLDSKKIGEAQIKLSRY